MSPILGIYASSMQPALNASSYESIATVTVGAGGTSTVTFSSIPGTYKHLQIRMFSRGTSTPGYGINFQFNSDTGNNYGPSHFLEGNGSSVSSGAPLSTSTNKIEVYAQPRSDTTASVFGAFIIDILDYANTNKYKTLRHFGGFDQNNTAGNYIDLDSGLWMSTSAINRIDITTPATGFAQYSSIALYGIKGA